MYNTATAGIPPHNVWPGFYYWDGSKWVRLLSGSGTSGEAWLLQGNSGTTPGTHFLGTTDNAALHIRVNNERALLIEPGSTPNLIGGHSSNSAGSGILGATIGGGGQDGSPNRVLSNYGTVGGGSGNDVGSGLNATEAVYATVSGGHRNKAIGIYSTVGGGSANTASGIYSTVGGGEENTASNQYSTVGGGEENTASGQYSTVGGGRQNQASGDYSTILGGSSNTANGNYNLVFGQNVVPSVNESHRVYFFGDGNITRPSGFLVINRLNGDHPIHVGTDNTNGNGAHLTTGGTWTNGSSRSFKERFVQYRPAEVLEKILQLPVEGYYYKGTEEYHITPMAEDFYRLFGTGVREIIETDSTGKLTRRPNLDVDKYLAASDVAGVALLGIKALAEENERLRQENAELRARLERLEKLMQVSLEQRAPSH